MILYVIAEKNLPSSTKLLACCLLPSTIVCWLCVMYLWQCDEEVMICLITLSNKRRVIKKRENKSNVICQCDKFALLTASVNRMRGKINQSQDGIHFFTVVYFSHSVSSLSFLTQSAVNCFVQFFLVYPCCLLILEK